MSSKPFVTRPADHQPMQVVGERISVLAHSANTGSYEVFLQEGPEGAGPPPHFHPWDESYYVLDGEVDVLLGERMITLRAGEFVHVPRGTVHNFRMRTASARFLSISSGAGAAEFFREFEREVKGPDDMATAVQVAARHLVQIPPPPQ
jgi:quercetin dioxygenase-like cupin family protein